MISPKIKLDQALQSGIMADRICGLSHRSISWDGPSHINRYVVQPWANFMMVCWRRLSSALTPVFFLFFVFSQLKFVGLHLEKHEWYTATVDNVQSFSLLWVTPFARKLKTIVFILILMGNRLFSDPLHMELNNSEGLGLPSPTEICPVLATYTSKVRDVLCSFYVWKKSKNNKELRFFKARLAWQLLQSSWSCFSKTSSINSFFSSSFLLFINLFISIIIHISAYGIWQCPSWQG